MDRENDVQRAWMVARWFPVVLVIGVVICLGCSKKKTSNDGASQPTAGLTSAPGQTPTGQNPPPLIPPLPKLNFDELKLGYDPYKPDMSVAVVDIPQGGSRNKGNDALYLGKIIATEGRIFSIGPDLRKPLSGNSGPAGFRMILFDANGQVVDAGSKTLSILVYGFGQDWHKYRPGQVVRVVGRGGQIRAREGIYLEDSVVLSVAGAGDSPMTTDQLRDALSRNPREYDGGTALDRGVILTGLLSAEPSFESKDIAIFLLASGKRPVECRVRILNQFKSKLPKRGETVMLVGYAKSGGPGIDIRFEGFYLPKP